MWPPKTDCRSEIWNIGYRGVSDVGFPIFADADFAFSYPRILDADIIYFIILGLWKWVSATDDGKNQKIMQLLNEWMKIQLMNETLRYDVLHNETI